MSNEQQVDQKPKGVRVFGPDNRYYTFPAGTTKEAAVSFFKKKGIISPESPAPKPSEAKPPSPTPPTAPKPAPTSPTVGQQADTALDEAQAKLAKARPRWDNPQQVLQDPTWYGRSMKYLGGEFVGAGKAVGAVGIGGAKLIHDLASALDPVEGYKRPLGEPQIQVGKDVVDIGKGLVDIGKTTWDFLRHFPEAEADPEKLGSHIVNSAMIVDGGIKLAKSLEGKFPKAEPDSVVKTAAKTSRGTPSRVLKRKAFEDAYVHAKGLDVAKKVTKAAKAVDAEVKTHAAGIAEQIDGKIPTGVVDAAGEAATILKEFNDVVKTPEKAHPVLVQMVKDAQATAPKLWTWEKARQFRSSVGRALGKVEGPQNAVLTRVYVDLTKKLGGAAKQYGLEKSWNHYNELASKMDKEFGDVAENVGNAQSGQEVAQKLGKDKGLTIEFVRNLEKYGLSPKEILDYIRTAQRILKRRDFWNTSIFRLIYGSPVTGAGLLLARAGGASYPAAALTGLTVGLASTFLVDMARVLRLSPSVIETMMKARELPGRMKFKEGTFPEGEEGTPQLPEKTGGPSTPKVPEGEPEIERIRRLGAGAKESMVDQVKAAENKTKAEAETKRLEWEKKQQTASDAEASKRIAKVEEGKHGTGKLAEQAKARERAAKLRKAKGPTAAGGGGLEVSGGDVAGKAQFAKENAEAQARAQSANFDVTSLQIPEMEEYVRGKYPDEYKSLLKQRKAGAIPDEEWKSALQYLVLNGLEE